MHRSAAGWGRDRRVDCMKIISCSRNRGRTGLAPSAGSSLSVTNAHGKTISRSLSPRGKQSAFRRHEASAVQLHFLFHDTNQREDVNNSTERSKRTPIPNTRSRPLRLAASSLSRRRAKERSPEVLCPLLRHLEQVGDGEFLHQKTRLK